MAEKKSFDVSFNFGASAPKSKKAGNKKAKSGKGAGGFSWAAYTGKKKR